MISRGFRVCCPAGVVQVSDGSGTPRVDGIDQTAQADNLAVVVDPELPWVLLACRVHVARLDDDCTDATFGAAAVVPDLLFCDCAVCRTETRLDGRHEQPVGESHRANLGGFEDAHGGVLSVRWRHCDSPPLR